ncbi:MAG: thiamine/thiamine pyrophosphate ABC transporter permease ThiP, partial [Mesorhizobium sp.]
MPRSGDWWSGVRRAASDPRVSAGIVAFAGLLFEGAHDFSGAWAAFDPYLLRVIRFTLWQAALSTLLSAIPALFVARALSRHPRFFGRAFILQIFAVPLALPAIVAALGILALYGRA